MASIFAETYKELVVNQKKELTFWVLAAFLPTFIFERVLVYLKPEFFINVRGTHIHHLTWGIILLAVAGYLALIVNNQKTKIYIAILYGIGLSLAFDEFGMWLRLKDDYYLRQSYDAMLIILFLLLNIVYFAKFWFLLLKRFWEILS